MIETTYLCVDTKTVPLREAAPVDTEQTKDQMASETSTRFVVLKRISTEKQGADGLGIASQERDINLFLQQHPEATVIQEFVEVRSGGKELTERPVLQEAMNLCRKTTSTLLVSRLSRLSRDAAFVLTLMKDTSIQFKVAAMPNADNF